MYAKADPLHSESLSRRAPCLDSLGRSFGRWAGTLTWIYAHPGRSRGRGTPRDLGGGPAAGQGWLAHDPEDDSGGAQALSPETVQGTPQVTTFFVAGIESQGERAEAAYRELCERSQIVAGCPARSRRIVKLSCRFDGRDCEIEVGRPLSLGRDVVVAILDHGREEAFVVHTAAAGAGASVRVRRPVYSVTEFS
jgi:hypothetical protein